MLDRFTSCLLGPHLLYGQLTANVKLSIASISALGRASEVSRFGSNDVLLSIEALMKGAMRSWWDNPICSQSAPDGSQRAAGTRRNVPRSSLHLDPTAVLVPALEIARRSHANAFAVADGEEVLARAQSGEAHVPPPAALG